MRLEFENVRFKNFLSFGSKWQEIGFQRGVNIITGRNGSGKSSCMETIPFALFGKTHKNVKKIELVNWKNRKGLEVQLQFTKGDNVYRVVRSIKPDNFEIWENDKLIEKPSNVRDYQVQLEDIIGTNFQTFLSLVHSNINSSQPIFSMSKPDKRRFIEKIFGLSVYSDITDNCNKKLSVLSNKIREMELSISNSKSNIVNSKQRISDVSRKISTFKSSRPQLNEIKEEIKYELDGIMDDTEYESMKKQLTDLTSQAKLQESLSNSVENKRSIIKTKIKLTRRETPDFIDIGTDRSIEDVKEKSQCHNVVINERQQDLREIESLIQQEKFRLNENKRKQKQLESGVCPTCGQSIHENMKGDMECAIELSTKAITNLQKELKSKNDTLDLSIREGMEIQSLIEDMEKANKDNEKRVRLLYKISQYEGALTKLDNAYNKIYERLIELNRRVVVLNESYDIEYNRRRDIERLKSEYESLKSKVESENTLRKELEAIISIESKSIDKLEKSIKENEEQISKLNNMKDYMEYIKIICMDGNIKSYAISSIVPILTRNVNSYLSDIGRPFYVQIDNWLEPTIKGPGITSGSYDNLSSGEAKSVDLSLQNAFLDIARIQAGVFPDILVYDELLDSSLDDRSLNTLLKIIDGKQKEDNNKVYIISHRDEISEVEAANTIRMSKEGGYSKCSMI